MRAIRDKAYTLALDALLFFILEELDMKAHFDSISKSKSEFEERRENIQELRQAAKRYSKYGPALKIQDAINADEFEMETALGNFLDDVSLVTDITGNAEKASQESRLVVNLMTIHASKGTEFDTVFVVGNEEGTLPSGLSLQEGEGSVALEEEKRLCYVAMTRAKTQLILTWRKEVTNFATWSDDGPRTSSKDRSRFLDALVSKKGGTKESSGKQTTRPTGRNPDQILQQRRSASSVAAPQTRRPNQRGPTTSQPKASRDYSNVPASWSPNSRPNEERRTTTNRGAGEMRTKGAQGYPSRTQPAKQGTTMMNASSRPPRQYDGPATIQSKVPQQSASRTNGTRNNGATKGGSSSATGPSSKTSNGSRGLDSTWIFPVGSDVVHGNLGKGVVLHPPSGDGNEMLVRVQFTNGRTMEFPASGTALVPDLGV
jgi:hypothetical protein